MPEETEKKMTKKEFWIRLGLWATLAIIVPVVYIAVAYGIFSQSKGEGPSLTGWGVIALIFTFVMISCVLKEAKKGLAYDSMVKQCLDGYGVLLWVLFAIILVHVAKIYAEEFERFLIVMFVCEVVAVPVNPMRKWQAQNGEGKAENFIVRVLGRFFKERDE